MPAIHRYNQNFTYGKLLIITQSSLFNFNFILVSSCTKYLIFLLNFIFWLFGGLLIGVGLYSGLDKFQATGLIKLDTYYDIILNISIVLVLSGGIVFIVSFCEYIYIMQTCQGNALHTSFITLRWLSWSITRKYLLTQVLFVMSTDIFPM